MKEAAATTAAFLTAPVLPGIAFAFTSPGLGGGPSADAGSLMSLSVVGYLYSLWFTALLALPLFLVLRKRGLIGAWWSVAGGAAVAAVIALFLAPAGTESWLTGLVPVLLRTCSVGMASGLVFWYVRLACLRVGSPVATHEA
jgi:hypothetical protein